MTTLCAQQPGSWSGPCSNLQVDDTGEPPDFTALLQALFRVIEVNSAALLYCFRYAHVECFSSLAKPHLQETVFCACTLNIYMAGE